MERLLGGKMEKETKQNKNKQIIDFGNLSDYIKLIEDIFQNEGLNVVEQELLLHQLLNRVASRVRKTTAQDAIDNVNIGGILKKVWKTTRKEDEDTV